MIEFIDRKIPNAYHGTSRENAAKIERERKFLPSLDDDCYLGTGIYFFEGSKELAEKWARRKFHGNQIGIIIAEIQLGRCLDLTIPEIRMLMREVGNQLEKKRPGKRITDPFVINYYCENIEKGVETVRGIFSKKDIHGKFYRLFPASRLFDDYIDICVRKDYCIIGFHIV
jgi:hypothetical protein